MDLSESIWALFQARQVVMSDIDPLTVEVARRNAVLNDLSEIPSS